MLFSLALKELRFDRVMTFCQIAAVASILAPLLLLFSMRHGILHELEDKLMSDPTTLSLTLDSSYRLDNSFFNQLGQRPEVGFYIPEITALNALVDIKFPGGVKRVTLLPTKLGDPVVLKSGIPNTLETDALSDSEIYMSASLALQRDLQVGDEVTVAVSRTRDSTMQSARLNMTIMGILSDSLVKDSCIMANLNVVNAIDDFRNGYDPKLLSDGSYERTTERYYAKFRLYAKDVNSVIPLYYYLVSQNFNVSSKVRDIENVQAIHRVLNFVFGVIAGVSVVGGACALGGLIFASFKARKRNYVLLRLMGHNKKDTYGMAIIESLIISILGFVVGFVLYAIGSSVFNAQFEHMLLSGMISHLALSHVCAFLVCTLAVATLIAVISVKFVFLKVQIADVLREA